MDKWGKVIPRGEVSRCSKPAGRRRSTRRKRAGDERHPIRCRLADRRRAIRSSLSEDVLAELCRRMVDARHSAVAGRRVRQHAASGRHRPRLHLAGRYRREGVGSHCTTSWRRTNTAAARSSPSTPRASRSGAVSPMATAPDDFPVLHELRAEGATDYVAFPLLFTDGTVHVATWATRQPGGFTPSSSPISKSVIAPLARIADNLRADAHGREPAQHLRRPQRRRADHGGAHPARRHRHHPSGPLVLRFAASRRSPARPNPALPLIRVLNELFECQVPAIEAPRRRGARSSWATGCSRFFHRDREEDAGRALRRRARGPAGEAFNALIAVNQAQSHDKGLSADPLRPGAAPRRRVLWQHRRRQPARLHLHRPGGEPRRAAGEDRAAARPDHRGARRDFAAHVPGEFKQLGECAVAGFADAAGGVRLDRTQSQSPSFTRA